MTAGLAVLFTGRTRVCIDVKKFRIDFQIMARMLRGARHRNGCVVCRRPLEAKGGVSEHKDGRPALRTDAECMEIGRKLLVAIAGHATT